MPSALRDLRCRIPADNQATLGRSVAESLKIGQEEYDMTKGRIVFQVEEAKLFYRNIQVKLLD